LRILIERLLAFTSDIDLAEDRHGPRGARSLEYEASFIIRGVENMYLVLKPSADFTPFDGPSIAPAVAASRQGEPAPGYSTAGTKIGTLMGNPAAKAILVKYFPGIDTDPRVSLAFGMTLRAVQAFAPDQFTIEALNAVDAELARLPAK
jgi:hypothetical protein